VKGAVVPSFEALESVEGREDESEFEGALAGLASGFTDGVAGAGETGEGFGVALRERKESVQREEKVRDCFDAPRGIRKRPRSSRDRPWRILRE
jgi:hypothetical protein